MLTEVWSDLRYRWRALVSRDAIEEELDAEVRDHIARAAAEYHQRGTSPAEALRRATCDFGGVERVKVASRDARGTVALESLLHDLRYAWRSLRARPALTAGVVLTLALGIGANTAMFGIADRLLLRPPAYLRDPARVHRVYFRWTQDRTDEVLRQTSLPRFRDVAAWTHSFSTVAAWSIRTMAVGEGASTPELPIVGASANYFSLFDAPPVLGRIFTADEDRLPTGSPVVVLTYPYWQAMYGGRRDVLGGQIRIGRSIYTIVGVLPDHFLGVGGQMVPQLYIPLSAMAWNVRPNNNANTYDWQWPELLVKRAPGVTTAAADADLTAAYQRSWVAEVAADPHGGASLAAARPHAETGPLQDARGPSAGPEARVLVWVSGVAAIVLLIACANVANLLLARAVTRRREIALKLALGVTRVRLIRQIVIESLGLAAAGGLVGLAIAEWGGSVVRALFLPAGMTTAVFADPRTLTVTLGVTVGVAVLTGLAPVLYAGGASLSDAIKTGERGATARSVWTRKGLLFAQAALSVVLLVGAGLFVRSLDHVRSMRLGYDVDPVVVVGKNLRGERLTIPDEIALENRLTDMARTVPGVVAASPSASIAFWSDEGRALFADGIDSVGVLGTFTLQAGNADFFRTMGTRIIRGRAFTDHDAVNAPRVMVVSEGMARAMWPGQDPIRKCVHIGERSAPCAAVVGVAEDLHLMSLTDGHEYTYYVPVAQYAYPTGTFVVRVNGHADDYTDQIRRHLQPAMPGAGYVTAVPLRMMIDPQLESWRLGATMFVAFSALALVLVAVGVYSVIAYGVAQQRQEIGVRIALGARSRHVLVLVAAGSLRLVLAGMVVGTVLAILGSKQGASLLFDESPTDPVVYAVVAAVLVIVALVATMRPAIAAVRVDPNEVLRSE